MKINSFSIAGTSCHNEDSLEYVNMGLYGIGAVLADGMGGLYLGNVAADATTKSIVEFLMKNYRGYAEKEVLHGALDYADKKVREECVNNKCKMGAAVAVAIIVAHRLYCTWQGNVRIYVRHDGKLNHVTTDHVAHIGYGHTALTRCIKGEGLREDVPFVCYKLMDNDKVFLCTDGMYNAAEKDMLHVSVDKLKKRIGMPEDDASLIAISL